MVEALISLLIVVLIVGLVSGLVIFLIRRAPFIAEPFKSYGLNIWSTSLPCLSLSCARSR